MFYFSAKTGIRRGTRKHQSRPSSDRRPPEAQKGFALTAHPRGVSSGHLAGVLSWRRWPRSCGPTETRSAHPRVWARLVASWGCRCAPGGQGRLSRRGAPSSDRLAAGRLAGGEASARCAPKARAARPAGCRAGRPPSAGSHPRAPAARRARRAARPRVACGGRAQAGRLPPEPAARPAPPPARPPGARVCWSPPPGDRAPPAPGGGGGASGRRDGPRGCPGAVCGGGSSLAIWAGSSCP